MTVSGGDRMLLEHVFPVDLPPGGELVVRGAVRTSFDGAVFDAATRTDTLADGSLSTRAGGLFDLEAGGLRVASLVPSAHEVHLVATGADAPACAALGLKGACLVPRSNALAHERLMTRAEFLASLSGSLQADALAPTPPSLARAYAADIGILLAIGVLAMFAAIFVRALRNRRSSAFGQVEAAARAADAAIGNDVDVLPLREQIAPLLARARDLEQARRMCERKLARVDRRKLEQRRLRWTASTDPAAAETLAWINREIVEATRLEQDLRTTHAGLARIESALRVLACNARSRREVEPSTAEADPVRIAQRELDLREEAVREAEAVLTGERSPITNSDLAAKVG
jgi:hypothetical protein